MKGMTHCTDESEQISPANAQCLAPNCPSRCADDLSAVVPAQLKNVTNDARRHSDSALFDEFLYNAFDGLAAARFIATRSRDVTPPLDSLNSILRL